MSDSYEISDNIITGPAIRNARQNPDKVHMISRFNEKGERTPNTLHEVTYAQSDEIIRTFIKGLWEMGFEPKDRLAVHGPNRPRWIYACLAAIFSGGVHVPIYPNSKPDEVSWILQDSGARFAVCDTMKHAELALSMRDKIETLEKIILMDPLPEGTDDFIMSFDAVLEKGRQSSYSDEDLDKRMASTTEDDLAAIIYTSGTTGLPKGVMLSHRCFVSQRVIEPEFDYSDNEVFLAHLPMCHSFGFSSDLLNCGNIGGTMFVADSLETMEMRKNLKDCRPTVMSSVPRLWEKFYIQINQTVKSKPERTQKLFGWALKVGGESFKLSSEGKPVPIGLKLQSKLANRLFEKVKKEVGLDRLKYSYTGGGPIDPKIIYFFGGMGIDLYQGYGLTETAPIINANTPKHNKIGTVGKPLSNVEEKIAEDGEILVRGPQVMKGYHNNPEATAEVLLDGGWFATGDIGEIDQDGFLKITDRKKELLKTSGGKYVAPQPIENEFNTDPYIEMVSVVGDGRKYITALVVPDFENIKGWLQENHGVEPATNEEMVDHPEVQKLIEERVNLVNQNLARFEQIKRFVVLREPFSEITGELTPSMKKKRRIIESKYKDKIDGMYPEE
ncbi:MAG: long-chain fatty acid--CoA ligase [bacterium]